MKATNSGVTLASGTHSAGPALDNSMLPNSEFYFTPLTDEIVYLTGISLV